MSSTWSHGRRDIRDIRPPRTALDLRKPHARFAFRALIAVTAMLLALGAVACSSAPPPAAPTGPSTIVMPDLVGSYWAEAQRELNSVGWTGMLDKGPDIPVGPHDHNRVMRQNPGAGEHVNSDVRIKVQFGN
ncbi:PASTA domain-containing protein [Mycolicibacterium sp.]|uniref:PASTA domain-containing protein n=1 Tax=Mycolicibacterium sp. TaxID=2320850 RepID=UPI0037C8BE07